MTRAMLLCAGLSTRLGALGTDRPKPLLPVCDIPIVAFGIARCVGHGIRDIVINLHHHGDLIERELGDGSAFGARITYSHEPVLLGTGGGLKRALPLLDPEGTDEPFVVMNGKLIFDLDLGAVLAAHARDPEVLGTMVVRKVGRAEAEAWGAVRVEPDAAGRLRVRDVLGTGEHMYGGVHVTRASVMRRLPDGEACVIRQGYLPWLRAGGEVAAFEAAPGFFAESSTPARYLATNRALVSGQSLTFAPGELAGVDERAHIHATARIVHPVKIGECAHIGENAVVGPEAVVGAHAVIEPGARIERAVVWPHARATGTVVDAVVTPRDTVDCSSTVEG